MDRGDDGDPRELWSIEMEQYNLEALERCYWQQAKLDDLYALACQLGVGHRFKALHPEAR